METRLPSVHCELSPSPARLGLVVADCTPSPPCGVLHPLLADELAALLPRREALWPAGRREAVRQMLRHGRYRPTGRGKPASEFLMQAFCEAANPDSAQAVALGTNFPVVSPLVDINNAVSLVHGFPASIFDRDCLGSSLVLRRGRSNERYVFNHAGHVIELADLLLVADEPGDRPIGNPVKDSMATKLGPSSRLVLAVIYAPVAEPASALEAACEHYLRLLQAVAGASSASYAISAFANS